MADLWRLSGLELREMIAAKEVKPSEIMAAVLARIEKLNPKLNAFCTITQDLAMAEARQADKKMVQEKDNGKLFGLPVSVKDLILTKGIRTTFGSKMYENFIPVQDGIVVERLKAAGAIVIGKTNSCEHGYKAVTDSPLWGITRNPWNSEMTPAGSSGGAGAAVASGMGPLALGSDGGGSVRAPASFCGIFGLKSSRGRIPMYPLLSGWETLDRRVAHYGPLTRTVGDAAMMLEVMAGPDDRDPLSLPGGKLRLPTRNEKVRPGPSGCLEQGPGPCRRRSRQSERPLRRQPEFLQRWAARWKRPLPEFPADARCLSTPFCRGLRGCHWSPIGRMERSLRSGVGKIN